MKTNLGCWEEVLSSSPESYKKWFEEEKKILQKTITPNSKVLDVGCGVGRGINDIISITKSISGIDHDKKAVTDAQKKFCKYPSIKFFQENAKNMSFAGGEFDFVICMGTFTNFASDKFVILDEIKRVLNKDGKIIISAYSENALNERMKVYNKLKIKINEIKKDGTVIFDESLGDNISEQFTKEELENIFSRTKLHIENITKAGIGYVCILKK
ncbi:MAG: class I SAM-dependent methyltransferase [Nanoarchaeota archaeon]|nr:class I SAM-dependent methyltransferase [Nanoarchaeota archaeon]